MNSAVVDQAQLRQLLADAEAANTRGAAGEAARLLSAAESLAPNDAGVLSALGVQSLRTGRAAEGRERLERATVLEPHNARHFLNLAACLRELKDPDAEMQALSAALSIDPYYYVALMQKGSLLESQGKRKQAARAYHAGLMAAGNLPIPQTYHSVIEHAQRVVAGNFRELDMYLEGRLREVRARYADDQRSRVDECLAAFVGRKRIYLQQPTTTYFPRLPAINFFERSEFPWLSAVEAASADMREELSALLASSLEDFTPYVAYGPDVPLAQWKDLNHSRRWSALFLFQDGQRHEANIARCPRTVAALAQAPQVVIPGRGPTAFFSRLEPKTRIPPHTGSTNSRLTVHIPLVVPPKCGFRVGGDVREWEEGKALIFDDTIEHEAWNESDEPRVVLIFDIWHPMLTAAERDMMAVATASIGEYFDAD